MNKYDDGLIIIGDFGFMGVPSAYMVDVGANARPSLSLVLNNPIIR